MLNMRWSMMFGLAFLLGQSFAQVMITLNPNGTFTPNYAETTVGSTFGIWIQYNEGIARGLSSEPFQIWPANLLFEAIHAPPWIFTSNLAGAVMVIKINEPVSNNNFTWNITLPANLTVPTPTTTCGCISVYATSGDAIAFFPPNSTVVGNVAATEEITGLTNVIVDGLLSIADTSSLCVAENLLWAFRLTDQIFFQPGVRIIPPALYSITLTPGIYSAFFATGTQIVNGTVILDAQGDPNAFFLFLMPFNFEATTGAEIELLNAAQAENVFWMSGLFAFSTADIIAGGFKGRYISKANVIIENSTSIDLGTVMSFMDVDFYGNNTLEGTSAAAPYVAMH